MATPLNQLFLNDDSGCFNYDPNSCTLNNWSFSQQQIIGNRAAATDETKVKQEVDALLSEAMNNLTFDEREKHQEVLHGIDDLVEEADLVQNALVELENTILRIKPGSVYEAAERMNPNYVRAKDFRIMFLRSTRYDVKATAEKILNFFEVKQALFGLEKLTKDITIEDLDDDDLGCLRSGWFQFSGKDRAGRTVLLQLPGVPTCGTTINELRQKYFMLMELLRDEDVQLRGVLFLTYVVGERDTSNGAGVREHRELGEALPLHIAAMHFCCSDLSQYILCKIGIRLMRPELTSRLRIHFGSPLECQYILSTFGITHENLPLLFHAPQKINMEHHMNWCRSYGVKPNSGTIQHPSTIEPTANDVLYVGGNRSKNSGNELLRNLVVKWCTTYDSGTNDTKRMVVNTIIDNIHETGGRFLIQSEEADPVWLIVAKEEVRLRITQAFRNYRRKTTGSRRKRK